MTPKTFLKAIANRLSDTRTAIAKVRQEATNIRTQRKKKTKNVESDMGEDTALTLAPPVRAKVDISMGSVVKASVAVALVAMSLYVIFLLKDIFILVLFSFFLAAILNPLVDHMERMKIPRGLGVILSYLIIMIVLVVFIIALVPMLKTQGDKLVYSITTYLQTIAKEGFTTLNIPLLPRDMEMSLVNTLNSIRENINLDIVLDQLQGWLSDNQAAIGGNLEKVATNFLGFVNIVANGLGNVIIVLLLTFFIIVDKDLVRSFFLSLLPRKHRAYFAEKMTTVQSKIGAWVRGQLLLGLAVGTATFIGFLILQLLGVNIEEKIILSVIAGFTELVPVVGPIIAAFFAILVAASLGTWPMFAVLILFVVIQQLENNILVPVIMRHAVGLNSLVIIIGMLIGASFMGFLGLILAVPVTTIIVLFVDDLLAKERVWQEEHGLGE